MHSPIPTTLLHVTIVTMHDDPFSDLDDNDEEDRVIN